MMATPTDDCQAKSPAVSEAACGPPGFDRSPGASARRRKNFLTAHKGLARRCNFFWPLVAPACEPQELGTVSPRTTRHYRPKRARRIVASQTGRSDQRIFFLREAPMRPLSFSVK